MPKADNRRPGEARDVDLVLSSDSRTADADVAGILELQFGFEKSQGVHSVLLRLSQKIARRFARSSSLPYSLMLSS